MVGGWPGKIILTLFAPALVVLSAIVLLKVSFCVKLVSALGAGELGRPGQSCEVCLALVVAARGVTLLDNVRPFSVCGRGGGGDDDRLVIQVHLHLLHISLLTSSSSPCSSSPTSCCIGISLQ